MMSPVSCGGRSRVNLGETDILSNAHRPVIGFAAYSGTGKTTLLKVLIPLLCSRGIRLGMVKHAHHSFDIDHPGKDSYELRKAGAHQVLVASARREALVIEHEDEREPDLNGLLERLDQDHLDLILVEGFKRVVFPKIELYRQVLGKSPIYPQDENVVAVATDGELPVATGLPVLDINDAGQVADFILSRFCKGQP